MDLNKGVPTLFAYCEKLIWKIFFKFKQGTCPWMAFAWNFFGIFMIFFQGGLWGKSFIGNIQYFGAQIFPVVWPVSGCRSSILLGQTRALRADVTRELILIQNRQEKFSSAESDWLCWPLMHTKRELVQRTRIDYLNTARTCWRDSAAARYSNQFTYFRQRFPTSKSPLIVSLHQADVLNN